MHGISKFLEVIYNGSGCPKKKYGLLLKYKISLDQVNKKNDLGDNALLWAVHNNRCDI